MISVVITVYNGEKYIVEQLETIRMQILQPDEVIICDDASSDNSVITITKYIKENKLEEKWKLYKNSTNMGYPLNFYYTIEKCNGEYIFFSDQDDYWKNDKIQSMIQIIEKYPNAELLSSEADYKRNNHEMIRRGKNTDKVKIITVESLMYKMNYLGMCMVIRKRLYNKYAHLLKQNYAPHDIALDVLAANDGSSYHLEKVTAIHRIHNSNYSIKEKNCSNPYDMKQKLDDIRKKEIELIELLKFKKVLSLDNIHCIDNKRNIIKNRYENLTNISLQGTIKSYFENHHCIRFKTFCGDIAMVVMNKI